MSSPNKILQQQRPITSGRQRKSQGQDVRRPAVVAGRARPLHPSQLMETLPEVALRDGAKGVVAALSGIVVIVVFIQGVKCRVFGT